MKKFMDKKFLLNSSTSERLYAAIADLPIVDYHCHLDAAEIYNDKHFASITEV
ncbi:MAG: glucuronate isomerase, partial [Firmicutes bacterium]|nr:glucuronate isomerase [Candidatus Stercoripulliclostridium pullicola]